MKLSYLKREAYISEFIGTFFLVFTVALNALQRTALAPLSTGSICMAMVFASGPVSGAHFNPAVTLGVVLGRRKQLSPVDVCAYMAMQLCGGLLAGALCWLVLGATYTLQPGHGYSAGDVAVVEVVFTAALVFVVLAAGTSTSQAGNHRSALAIGFSVLATAFAIGGISDYSLNPAVALGVMITNWMHVGVGMTYFLLYLMSPLGGAVLAAGLFHLVLASELAGSAGERARILPPAS